MTTEREPFIPVSAWYTGGRARATMVRPPDENASVEWRQDLRRIKDAGFNTVRCWIDWASGEPEPGRFDFSALDLTMGLAHEVGLRVVIQLYLDSAPDWPINVYPDARYVSNGDASIVSEGSPGFCYDNPGIRASAAHFMTVLADHVSNHPAFYAWDLWSEPHIVQWSYFDFLVEPGLFCYCAHTAARFREWLRQKYHSLDALNAAWYRTFPSWDDVQPPRFITLMTYAGYIDWLHFMMDKLAEDLRWRHDTVRSADSHLTTSHSAVPSLLTLPISSHGSPDDWRMVDSVDVYGTSLYPKHVGARETNEPSFRAALLTSTRSSSGNRPYWLGELQGGHGYVGMFAADVTGEDVRTYGWECLAHGAKGLNFYAWYPMNCGYESAGFGLTNLDGTPSERAQAAGAIARTLGRDMELFYSARPVPSAAAICWNVTANIMWCAMREKSHYVPSRCYLGAYRALFRQRIPADFVHVDEIAHGKLDEFRVLYLPFALAIPRAMASQIGPFVQRGGVAVAEARTGWNDETGHCGLAIPGFGLEEVFGCRARGAEGFDADTPVPIRIVLAHPALPFLAKGDILSGALFGEILEPRSEQAVVVGEFEDGSPAIVVHPCGQGWGVLAGSFISLGYFLFDAANSGRFLQGLAEAAGVRPPVTVETANPASVEARLLEGNHDGQPYTLFFAFNYAAETIEGTFSFKSSGAPGRITDLIHGEALSAGYQEGRVILDRRLGPNEVWVAKITA